MNQTNLIILHLNTVAASAEMLIRISCKYDRAGMIADAAITLLDIEEKAENDILLMEMDSTVSEAVKACRSRLLKCNRTVIGHLEKFQLQGYHFEEAIHSLKLENENLSEEIHLA